MIQINNYFQKIEKFKNVKNLLKKKWRRKLFILNLGRCIVIFTAKSEIQNVFCMLPNETKINKKSTIQKVLRTLILHINTSQKLVKIIN